VRYSRLSVPPGSPPLVAVAHGSKDPRAAATVSELVAAVRARAPGLDVRAAFLGHCAPSLPQALRAVRAEAGDGTGRAVVVPLLLTAAYHSKTDIPAQVAAAGVAPALDVMVSGTLGPHPFFLPLLERRVTESGGRAGTGGDGPARLGRARLGTGHDGDGARAATSVVLAAAGSADPAANAAVAAIAAEWERDAGWRRVVPAYASAAAPSPAQAVLALRAADPGGRVLVATYLLGPGYFADKIRAAALGAGAAAVSGVLGAAPEVADVVLDRYASAAADFAARPPGDARIVCGRAQLSARSACDCLVRTLLHPGKQTWNGCKACWLLPE
jgi:sirohydrochlorin ferrochelatase